MPTPIVSFVNLKGGVGKTALAVNFAAYCGSRGLSTLLIDLDPQTNATFASIGFEAWERWAADHGTVADVFGLRTNFAATPAPKAAEDVIIGNAMRGVDLLPSHLDLFTIDLDLAAATARETKLRRALQPITESYQVIVCDCPPNLTIPTQNALAASTHYVVPISPDFLSALGVGLLINRIKGLCNDLEHTLIHAGIVISRHGRPSIHRSQTVETLRQQFPNLVLNTVINERSAVSEMAAAHSSIFQSSDQAAKNEFSSVSADILARIGVAP